MRSPLIDAAELRAALQSPDRPALLDVRWTLSGPPGIDDYGRGHIPGAVFVDLDAELSAPPGPGGRHPLPDADAFTADMRAAGVSGDRARGRLRRGQLDGRRARLVGASLLRPPARVGAGRRHRRLDRRRLSELETAAPAPAGAGDFVAAPGGMPLLDAEGAAALAETGVLLDARAPERFAGDESRWIRWAATSPARATGPARDNVGGDGRFLEPAALRDAFGAARCRRRGGARRLLRVGRVGRARGAGARARRLPGRAVPGLVERVGHRPEPACGSRS